MAITTGDLMGIDAEELIRCGFVAEDQRAELTAYLKARRDFLGLFEAGPADLRRQLQAAEGSIDEIRRALSSLSSFRGMAREVIQPLVTRLFPRDRDREIVERLLEEGLHDPPVDQVASSLREAELWYGRMVEALSALREQLVKPDREDPRRGGAAGRAGRKRPGASSPAE
jgi:plasmid stabilization system protein ParE